VKKALITGITGQDGSYLAELLLSKGYEVHLAAQSHVRVSFDMPDYTSDITALGTIRVLEAVRTSGVKARVYQASSSEMFGAANPPQSETTVFMPQSPYAASKVYAYWVTRQYREGYGLFASNGILFNHESPRRGETFVTRKITRALANIVAGKQQFLYLGNLDAKRDWGYAPDYVAAMWKMMQYDLPVDLVIGTGEAHSVRELLDEAFGYMNMDWKAYVKIDPRYFRPNEVNFLQADFTRARELLGWEPRVLFKDLVKVMVDADLELSGLESRGEGCEILKKHHGEWHRWGQQVISMDKP
jgi:GDPmannose 4,6-dehydratase